MQRSAISLASRLLKITVVAAGMLLWTSPAHAYLDPATGSVLLQGLLAGIAGLMVVLRLYWSRIKALIRRWLGRPEAPVE